MRDMPVPWNLTELQKPWNATAYARLFRWGELFKYSETWNFCSDSFMWDVFVSMAFVVVVMGMSGQKTARVLKILPHISITSTYSSLTPRSRFRLGKLMFLVTQEFIDLLWSPKDDYCLQETPSGAYPEPPESDQYLTSFFLKPSKFQKTIAVCNIHTLHTYIHTYNTTNSPIYGDI
jgi:hypothetical protein